MNDPITICHVNVAKHYRGGERQTELLIRELARPGVRQALVCRRGAPLSQRSYPADVEVRPVSGGLLSVLRACAGASLIHVHEGRSVYPVWLRSRWSKLPFIITRRVNNPIGEHRWAHRAYSSAFAVVAVAPQIGVQLREYDPRIRVEVVFSGSSGFEVDPFAARDIRQPVAEQVVIGHVGALDNAQKGHEYMLAVARRAQEESRPWHFFFVGGGKDEASLRTAAAGLQNVTFTGFVDNVGDYLAAFDIFMLPSNREGIGSILFDAMERGLPLIASRVGGLPDIVEAGANGLLIDPAAPTQLYAAIEQLAADHHLRERLGREGARRAPRYTAAAMAARYWSLYQQALFGAAGVAE